LVGLRNKISNVSLENMNVEEITRLYVAELKNKLKILRLPSSGLKAVLQERLIFYFEGENIDQQEITESSKESVYETNVQT